MTDGALATLAVAVLLGYVLGTIPFGVVLTRLAGYGDIRRRGSGNIGTTNVLRTGSKVLAALTLILDGGKGAAAVLAAAALTTAPLAPLVAGGAAFLGHIFPVWLSFKGGKGVATFLGTLLALHWPLGLAAMGVWILVAGLVRYSSLSALISAASAAVLGYPMTGDEALVVLVLLMTIVIFLRHRDNIRRLMHGEEGKIGQSDKAS